MNAFPCSFEVETKCSAFRALRSRNVPMTFECLARCFPFLPVESCFEMFSTRSCDTRSSPEHWISQRRRYILHISIVFFVCHSSFGVFPGARLGACLFIWLKILMDRSVNTIMTFEYVQRNLYAESREKFILYHFFAILFRFVCLPHFARELSLPPALETPLKHTPARTYLCRSLCSSELGERGGSPSASTSFKAKQYHK